MRDDRLVGLRVPRSVVRMARQIYLAALDALDRVAGRSDELIPPRTLHFVGGGDFRSVGNAFLGHFREIGKLGPNECVLDIGCGTGRMAVPLLGYLGERGSYIGFDVSRGHRMVHPENILEERAVPLPSCGCVQSRIQSLRYHSGRRVSVPV